MLIVIKANTSIKGQITTAGWEGFRRAGHEFVSPKDATIVAKFKASGAIIVGLANMPDLAASDTNRSSSFGRTGNAYDVRFSPGGSSGGVVTAVASNMAVLGNGTTRATRYGCRSYHAPWACFDAYVSIAGIAPLTGCWMTGPIAPVMDADRAGVMSWRGSADCTLVRRIGRAAPYEPHSAHALGQAIRVPAFVLAMAFRSTAFARTRWRRWPKSGIDAGRRPA